MRSPLGILHEILAVVAGGGDGQPMQRDGDFTRAAGAWRRRFFQRYPPGLAIGLEAGAAQLAADFNQIVAAALGFEVLRQPVHAEALGHCRQIKLHPAGLEGALARGIQFHRATRHAGAHGRHIACTGRHETGFVMAAGRAEAPQVHQQAGAGIAGAPGLARNLERVFQHFEKAGWQHMPGTGAGAVEAAQVGGRLPMAHLAHHLVQLLLQAGL